VGHTPWPRAVGEFDAESAPAPYTSG
jgi:hypothetical protein